MHRLMRYGRDRQTTARALAAVLHRKVPLPIIPRADHEQGRRIGIWFCDTRHAGGPRSSIREVNVYEPHVYRHVVRPTRSSATTTRLSTRRLHLVVAPCANGEMQVFSAGATWTRSRWKSARRASGSAWWCPILAFRYPVVIPLLYGTNEKPCTGTSKASANAPPVSNHQETGTRRQTGIARLRKHSRSPLAGTATSSTKR